MELSTLSLEKNNAVACITLMRPDRMNAFNAQMRKELLVTAHAVNNDPDIRAVVLTGGGRGFCAGADLEDLRPPGFTIDRQLNEEYKPILMTIAEGPKPWISAVNGAAAGIGAAFAMTCDLTVMGDKAYLYMAFAAIGLIPDGGATWHLSRALGRKSAYEMIVGGDKLAAARCLELGLCNRVVPDAELVSAAITWAEQLAKKAPLSLSLSKLALARAEHTSLGDTISYEAALQRTCTESADAREGILAFKEKRSPVFTGR
ncbi:MAG: enoyl-CoA hydratase [Hydrocarboniphaga sp.]|uniref:enoyl-CoA hydratase/isomerase family protein n=1 Tax=Hydrocarboniphaga sp. TaxID=2033016 RepID=UPI0026145028|nr:enoyl-CoA hydratase-related protein [Hydrocarboniphaga sp.]MDB5969177.1 enoyl-CoA hydratase [Hydrocarboniphaga sp.]